MGKRADEVLPHQPSSSRGSKRGQRRSLGRFTQAVVDTRNYLTHYNESLKDRCLRDEELFTATERLRVWLEVLLLQEIGFSRPALTKLLEDNPRMLRLTR